MINYNINEEEIGFIREKMKSCFEAFINDTHPGDLGRLITSKEYRLELIEIFMQGLISAEFELFMGFPKNHRSINGNHRNGSHKRSLNTTDGVMSLDIHHDRDCEFFPSCLKKKQRRVEELSISIIKLFEMGMSNKQIINFVDDMYGSSYSKQTVSLITEVINDTVIEFKNRALSKRYVAIFIDATYVPIRFENKFEKQALHLVVGINALGLQEVLGYVIGFNENNEQWAEILDDIKKRGVENVDIFVSDGFVGIDKIIKQRFPTSRIQRCIVHLMRNVKSRVKTGDKKSITSDLSLLFKIDNIETLEFEKNRLLEKWSQYANILNPIFENEYAFTYIDFPTCIHRTINTTNRIESVNQKIKIKISHKQQFPNNDSFERILVSTLISMNHSSTRVATGMKEYLNL